MKESNIVRNIMLKTARLAVLFINTRGMFLTLDGKRKVRAGLQAPGSSDLVGFLKVTITQDMVGKKFARFACVEVKTDKGVASHAQRDFVAFVLEQGGLAGVARSPKEAMEILLGSTDYLS